MINVTEKIKKAYENSTTQIDKITINNKDYRITNVDYYDDCYLDGNIFGTAIGRMLEFEIENTIELEKAEVKYSTGLLINGTEHWISLGNFIVESIEPNDTTGINKVIAMDYMLKTNVEYESNLDYSSNKITLLQVLQEVCTNSGLELATTSFANSNFIVDSNQFEEGTLNRQVIQAVAQISGTFAKIKSDNKLYLITPKRKGLLVKDVHVITVAELNALPVEKLSACDNEFNLNSYKELVIKRNTHPINLVSLGISDIEGENVVSRDEDSISKDGENSLVINDNPFAYTEEKRKQLITALFECVKGFEYTAYEISGQSKPYLETGDEIVAIDKEGNLYNSFLLRFNFKSPKGLESEMSAPSITKATVEYQNVPSALDVAKRTEIKVDKQNQKIELLVSQQSETGGKLSKVEQTVDGITQSVSEVEEKVEIVEEKADVAQETADQVNNDLATKYYTKTETNSQINQKSEEITSTVSKTYSTKTETSTAKQEAINSANTNTDNKLKNYSTTEQMNSAITQKANEISLEVGKKVNNEDFTSANITLKLNDGTSEAKIKANKIDINGTVSANGNFKVDTDGNMSCNNANITGGKIHLTSGTNVNPNFKIEGEGLTSDNALNRIFSDSVQLSDGKQPLAVIGFGKDTERRLYGYLHLETKGSNVNTDVNSFGITTPTLTQTSLAEQKKNFEKLQDNAIDIIKNIDIYKYNLKSENDTDKKHIGFVIGDDYNYSKEVTSIDNKGVDNYSFTSLCCKAIQEQQELIESLQKQVKELKEGR